MRFKLVHKLFLVLALTSLSGILLFALIAHATIGQNFVDYLNRLQLQHTTQLADMLVQQRNGEPLIEQIEFNPRLWRSLMRELRHSAHQVQPPHERSQSAPMTLPPPRPRPSHEPPGRRPGGGPPPPYGPANGPGKAPHQPLIRGITVYDSEQQIIIGKVPYDRARSLTAVRSNGKILGWVGAPDIRTPQSPVDIAFAKRQRSLLGYGALVAVLLSLGAAAVMARRLTRPISALSEAATDLASGRTNREIPVQSEDELGQLSRDFNTLAQTLSRNERARQRWIADISHELRTPLAVMRAEVDAVLDGIRTPDQGTVASIDQECQRLTRLVDDLYQLARADIGALDYNFETVSMATLVDEAVSRYRPRLIAAGLQCDFQLDPDESTPPDVKLDRQRIAQLLDIVFENCCHYVAAPGTVHVGLSTHSQWAIVNIDDTGPGVAKENLEALFEPLHREDYSRSRRSGGSGLGLAIARRIADGHDGKLSASASDYGGLRITLKLKLERPG